MLSKQKGTLYEEVTHAKLTPISNGQSSNLTRALMQHQQQNNEE